jgi:hypothetical protein
MSDNTSTQDNSSDLMSQLLSLAQNNGTYDPSQGGAASMLSAGNGGQSQPPAQPQGQAPTPTQTNPITGLNDSHIDILQGIIDKANKDHAQSFVDQVGPKIAQQLIDAHNMTSFLTSGNNQQQPSQSLSSGNNNTPSQNNSPAQSVTPQSSQNNPFGANDWLNNPLGTAGNSISGMAGQIGNQLQKSYPAQNGAINAGGINLYTPAYTPSQMSAAPNSPILTNTPPRSSLVDTNNQPSQQPVKSNINTPSTTQANTPVTPAAPNTPAAPSTANSGNNTQLPDQEGFRQRALAIATQKPGLLMSIFKGIFYQNQSDALNIQKEAQNIVQGGPPASPTETMQAAGTYNAALLKQHEDFQTDLSGQMKDNVDGLSSFISSTPKPTKLVDWTNYNQKIQDYQQNIQDITKAKLQGFNQYTQLKLTNPGQISQASTPQEITATNPKTKQQMVFRGGKWQTLQ